MAKKRSRTRPKPAPKPPQPEPPDEPACRACGCTDSNGCAGGCYWVLDDLCSACAVTLHVTSGEYTLLRAAVELVAGADDLRVAPVREAAGEMLARMPQDPTMLPMWQAEP